MELENLNNRMLKELDACSTLCNICYDACLHEPDVSIMARCIELDRDCSEICHLTASMLSRNSEFSDDLMELCAKICLECAEECEKHPHAHCKKCAQVCRTTADLCRSPHSVI
jgi:hypothetical protein